ncbi:MAG: hypothetical protein K6G64_05660 [Eubacterium sp.]|nr:hypothetical protein [Eubacterium sp.]
MKGRMTLLLSMAMIMSLTACGSKQDKKSEVSTKIEKVTEQKNTEEIYQVALLQSLTQGY